MFEGLRSSCFFFLQVTTEFVYFVDDDVFLAPSALEFFHGLYGWHGLKRPSARKPKALAESREHSIVFDGAGRQSLCGRYTASAASNGTSLDAIATTTGRVPPLDPIDIDSQPDSESTSTTASISTTKSLPRSPTRSPPHTALCPCSHVQAMRRAYLFDGAVPPPSPLERYWWDL